MHALVEEAVLGAAVLLRAVHRGVGVADHVCRGQAAVGERDADARPHVLLAAAHGDRGGKRLDEALDEPQRVVLAVDVLVQHDELVAADAGDRVARAQRLAQALGDGAQQGVARLVPEGVVDQLEAVEVDEQDRGQLAALAPPAPVCDPVGQQRPVGQAGQRVVERLVADRLLGGLAGHRLGQDVADRLDEVDLVAAEAARLGAVRGQDAERTPLATDDDAGAGGDSVVDQEGGALEARVGGVVADDDRAARAPDEARVPARAGRVERAAHEALVPADAGDEAHRLAVVGHLEELAEADAERARDRGAGRVAEDADAHALERGHAQRGDRRLLPGAVVVLGLGLADRADVARDGEDALDRAARRPGATGAPRSGRRCCCAKGGTRARRGRRRGRSRGAAR